MFCVVGCFNTSLLYVKVKIWSETDQTAVNVATASALVNTCNLSQWEDKFHIAVFNANMAVVRGDFHIVCHLLLFVPRW